MQGEPHISDPMNQTTEHTESTEPAAWRSRWYSAATRGTVGAIAGTAFAAAVAFLFLSLGIGPWAAVPVAVAPPLAMLAGIVWGAVRPRAYAPARKPAPELIAAMAIFGIPLALFLCFLVWVSAVFFVGTSGERLDFSADVFDAAATRRGGRFVERTATFVPPGATNFRCEGYSGWGGAVRFSCEVGESNFLAHAAANGVELRSDDPTFSADPATAEWCRGYMPDGTPFLDCLTDGTRPERFWYHDRRFENGGGWTVLYDIDRGVLYGYYNAN